MASAGAQTPGGLRYYETVWGHARAISGNASDPGGTTQYGAGRLSINVASNSGSLYLIVEQFFNRTNRFAVPVGPVGSLVGMTSSNWTLWSDTNKTTVLNTGLRWGLVQLATNSFTWTFTPNWAGSTVQIKATNGTSLGTWGLPAAMSSNYVLSSSIITNAELLTGAQVYLDGIAVSALALSSTNADLEGVADRPGYEFEFGPDYSAGEWQVRRADGSVAASGSAASLGTALTGRITVAEAESASVWTRVPAGDGMGSVWVNSGVAVQGNGVTSYNFATLPSPTPAPTPNLTTNTPAPAITNAPTPAPTPGTNTVATVPASTNDVTVDVDEIEPIPSDDGEQGVLDGVVTAHERLRGILEDAQGSFENVALTFNEFRLFALGGVGTNCTFTMGNVTINLGGIVPDFIRTGMKLIILMTAVFAGIKYTWETFR